MSYKYEDIDKTVDAWTRGKLTNSQFRKEVMSLGGKVVNKRLGPNDNASTILIDLPDGTSQYGWKDGGTVSATKFKGRF